MLPRSAPRKCCLTASRCIRFCSALNHRVTLLLINAPLKLCLGATKVYWVENYFKYREQAVKPGNMFSSIKLIATGNPSGIHLEPLLFYFLPPLTTWPRFVEQRAHRRLLVVWCPARWQPARGDPQCPSPQWSSATCPATADQGSHRTIVNVGKGL